MLNSTHSITRRPLIKIYLLGCLLWAAQVYAVGLMPTPTLTNAQISADASFDQAAGTYTYAYTVTNPASNTGEIWDIKIDVSADALGNGNASGLTIPSGLIREDFATVLSDMVATNNRLSKPWPLQPVPFGQNVPPGWFGDLGIDSVASFYSGDDTPNIVPGTSLGGFQLISYGVPTIRDVQIIPLWMHIVDNHDNVSTADRLAAGQIERDIIFHTVSLGPSGVAYGSFAHWNQLRDDLAQAIQLGWISDNKLAKKLTSQLAYARQALDAHDLFTAKSRLPALLDTINQSTPAQRSSEGFALVALNVQSLIDNTGDNQIEPKITLAPKSAVLSIGSQQSLSVTLIDLANGSRPLAGIPIRFRVDSGPNAGNLSETQTDAQGKATITYTGQQVGTDKVIASALFYGGEVTYDDAGIIVWAGGPDLVVPFFSPPLLKTAGGRIFYVNEMTQNLGNIATPPSVTRYFISPDKNFSPDNTRTVGERQIPALQPDKSSTSPQQTFTIPGDFPVGMYYLAACADADHVIVELDESNNCSYNEIKGRQSIIVPMETPNHPPSCDLAAASVATLWPPNHQLVNVAVMGVTDPENDPVILKITGITQDEPVNGLGDGDTSPDGFGIGTSQAILRAERSGTGNGRVYAVSFTASDGIGGTCSGTVKVGVPHDQGKNSTPVDDGQIYDSTKH